MAMLCDFNGAKGLLFTVKLKELTRKCLKHISEILVQRLATRESLSAVNKPRFQGYENYHHFPIIICICKMFITLFWQRDRLPAHLNIALSIMLRGIWNRWLIFTMNSECFDVVWKLLFLCFGDDSVSWYYYGYDKDLVLCSLSLTLWSRSSSKWYLRIQPAPQIKHNTLPLRRLRLILLGK
jgi:hypothetical protein